MKLTEAVFGEKPHFSHGRKVAQQIIKRWGDKPEMIKKAIEAADAAGYGEAQDVFPQAGIRIPEEGYMEIAETLREFLGMARRH